MNKRHRNPPCIRFIATGYPYETMISGITPRLPDNEIHVWTVSCRDLNDDDESLTRLLSRDERQASSQFKKTTDARDYSLRHGYLRRVLGHYLRTDPALVPLATGDHGKPGVGFPRGLSPLSFSLSHSRGMIALAVAGNYDVGIDIVRPDEGYPFREAADYLFSPAEKAAMERAPADLQYRGFFWIWAMKEAVLKARGGTAMMLRDIDTSAIADQLDRDLRNPIHFAYAGQQFFIHGSAREDGHSCVIAAGVVE
jgi:4'-phosphopantetheinyl transferase